MTLDPGAPMKFTDARTTLPRHPSKEFSYRDPDGILGGVLHQTAGGTSAEACARYHVGPNHVSETGCPGLLYTFFIEPDGGIFWAHDLDRRVWSQGGKGSPIPGSSANGDFLSICLGGDFDGPTHEGRDGDPTFEQLHAALSLWGHLTGAVVDPRLPSELEGALSCSVESLWGHHRFGKPNCPGTTGAIIADAIRRHLPPPSSEGATVSEGGTRIETDLDWQTALKTLGFDPGALDGIWGPASRSALVAFQRTRTDLVVDGERGPMSRGALEKELSKLRS